MVIVCNDSFYSLDAAQANFYDQEDIFNIGYWIWIYSFHSLHNVLWKIFVSNNVVRDGNTHKCVARSKRSVAFAEQLSEIEAYRPEKRFADAVKGLHLYGAKIVFPGEYFVMKLNLA